MLDIRLDDFYEERVEELKAHYREPTGSAVIRMLIRNASQEANRWPVSAGREEGEERSNEVLRQEYAMLPGASALGGN